MPYHGIARQGATCPLLDDLKKDIFKEFENNSMDTKLDCYELTTVIIRIINEIILNYEASL